jgi:hypothetical protein
LHSTIPLSIKLHHHQALHLWWMIHLPK